MPHRSPRLSRLAAFALAAGLAVLSANVALASQEAPPLRAAFWMDLEPAPREEGQAPIGEEAAARLLLEEAGWVFSGMIDGFDFAWTPSDLARAVAERFTLGAAGKVMTRDPRLAPGMAGREGNRLEAWVEFAPDAADRAKLDSQGREPWRPSQGRGVGELALGFPGRRAAYEDAVREGIRALLRTLEPNKPRLVRGRAVFSAAPMIAVVGGRYLVTARLRVVVTEVLAYEVW